MAVAAKLINSYVRSVLEFGHGVWAPNIKRDIDLLESVQRRATRIPFGRNPPEYCERMSLMNLPLLSDRRKRDVILVYQALTGDKNSPFKHLFPLNDGGRTRRHDLKLGIVVYLTSLCVNWAFFGTNELNTRFFCSTSPLKAPNRLKPLKLA
jgi:hypothetical protein